MNKKMNSGYAGSNGDGQQSGKCERIETRNKRTPLETVVPLPAPYVIYIDPCGACNFGCHFCPCKYGNHMDEERFKIMPMSLFKKITDDMGEFEGKVKVVDLWAWGEPFLNRDLVKMISYLRGKNVCGEIRTCTNGSFLNPDLNQEIVDSGLDLIRISVNALDAAGYKEICGVDMDYEKFMDNIKDLYHKSRGKTKVSIKIVESALKNESDVERFYAMFGGISDYTFVEDIVDAFPGYENLEKPDNSKITFRKWNSYSDRANYVCAKPLVQMAIHSNGAVSACCNDWKFATQYGNAHTDKLKDLWRSEKLKRFRLMQLELPRKQIPYCSICDCESDDDIDGVADIIARRIRDA